MKKLMSVILSVLIVFAVFIPSVMMSAEAFSIEIDNGGHINAQMASESMLLNDELENYGELKSFLAESLMNCDMEINISSFGIYSADISALTSCIYYDIPAAFHVKSYSYYQNRTTGQITRLVMTYNMDEADYKAQLDVCESTAESFISDLKNSSLSEAYKALLVHDRLIEWCEYDYQNLLNDSLPDNVYQMNGVLVNAKAVCAGYSKAYKFILEKLGITCFLCDSDELNHEWNIVVIDGKRYHVDTAWDDPVWDIFGRVNHTNFLRSTNGMIATGHEASDFDTSPVSTTYDSYYWQSSETEFQYKNGILYYYDTPNKNLNKIENGTTITLRNISDRWTTSGGYYGKSFVRLDSDNYGNYLFYSTPSSIYKYDLDTNTVSEFYTPDKPADRYWIYGFKAQDDYFYLNIYNNANLDASAYDYNLIYKYYDSFIVSDSAPYIFDYQKKLIYGNGIMTADESSLLSCFENPNITVDFNGLDRVATGTKVQLVDDTGEVYDTAYVVIIGDVNGDGWYDGTDSIIVSCIMNGILSEAQVGQAAYFAADCNQNRTIDNNDIMILERAGLLLGAVDQGKSPSELAEDSVFSEYISLIEGNYLTAAEEKTETVTEITAEAPDSQTDFRQIIDFVLNIIKSLLSKIISIFA